MYKTHVISYKEYRGVIISMTPLVRAYWIYGLLLLSITSIFAPLAITNAYVTSDISKFYKTNSSIVPGTIVGLTPGRADYVEPVKSGSNSDILGVAVGPGNSTLELNNSTNGVNVAISGRTEVLIKSTSTSIQRGNYIGLSDRDGVGDVAYVGQKTVGIAEASSSNLTDENGFKKLPILVVPGIAPGEKSQSFIASVAGRNVSGLQIFFATIIAIFGLSSIGFLSYSAVRNGLFAIGRNPLAKPAILGGLMQVMFMVSLIALVCVGLMYVTLRI